MNKVLAPLVALFWLIAAPALAQVAISQLPAATTPLTGAEVMAGVQNGQTVKINTYAVLTPYASVSGNTMTLGTNVTYAGSTISPTYGGTGVNNASKTITLGASLVTTGAGTPTLAFPGSSATFTFPSASKTLMASDFSNGVLAGAVNGDVVTINSGGGIQDGGVLLSGIVSGPASSTSGDLASFNGTGGKTIQDTGILSTNVVTLAGSQILTNKTITFASNTLTGVAPLASPTFTGTLTFGSNVAGAFGTAGVNLVGSVYTQTDSTTAAGTVATAYGSVRNAATFATAANAVTITNAYGGYYVAPIAGAHTTLTNGWALGADSLRVNGVGQVNSLGIGISPTNILDITQSQNAGSMASLLNATTGAAAYAAFQAKADETTGLRLIQTSTTYNTAVVNASDPVNVASATELVGGRGGGIILGAANGPIRFYANSLTTEAGRFTTTGKFLIGATSVSGVAETLAVVGTTPAMFQAGNGSVGMYMTNTSSTALWQPMSFNVNGTTFTQAGSIVVAAGGGSTAFNTTSDARLKSDHGIATDTSVLARLKIHNFSWIRTGMADRGVFAQEAYKVKPSAVFVGGPDPNRKPWQVDYSKFVPDLIVGWQNHEARIAELERKVANDDMRERLDPYAHAFCISKLCIGWK